MPDADKPRLGAFAQQVAAALARDLPVQTRDGGFIAPGFDPGLEGQPLGDAEVIMSFGADMHITLVRHEQHSGHLKPIGRKAVDTE